MADLYLKANFDIIPLLICHTNISINILILWEGKWNNQPICKDSQNDQGFVFWNAGQTDCLRIQSPVFCLILPSVIRNLRIVVVLITWGRTFTVQSNSRWRSQRGLGRVNEQSSLFSRLASFKHWPFNSIFPSAVMHSLCGRLVFVQKYEKWLLTKHGDIYGELCKENHS